MRKYFLATIPLSLIFGFVLVFLFEVRPFLECSPRLLSKEWYIDFCESMKFFNDYSATLFNVGGALDGAKDTDVLIFGNSTTQTAFSTVDAVSFFKAHDARFFLLGYGGEGWAFPSLVVAVHGLNPRVAVLNITGDFFNMGYSPPASSIVEHPVEAYLRSQLFALYQRLQGVFCRDGSSFILCTGSRRTFYRSRVNGTWKLGPRGGYDDTAEARYGCELGLEDPGPNACGNKLHPAGVSTSELTQPEIDAARTLVGKLSMDRTCVVITAAPVTETEVNKARQLADRLGATFIDVDKSGLYTTDNFHLFMHSAEVYSRRFFAALAPVMARCKR
jgi:hypothetical protein